MDEKRQSDFFDKLRERYTAEDFTGNIGVLLSDCTEEMEEDVVNGAINFMQDIYDLASESL